MSNQSASMVTKLDVLEKANAIVLEKGLSAGDFLISSVGNLELSIIKGTGDFEGNFSDKVEYLYCVRGSVHYTEFRNGDQEIPTFDLKAGELMIFQPGWISKGTCSEDTVLLYIS